MTKCHLKFFPSKIQVNKPDSLKIKFLFLYMSMVGTEETSYKFAISLLLSMLTTTTSHDGFKT